MNTNKDQVPQCDKTAVSKSALKFEYGFNSGNGIVKKRYYLSEIPFMHDKCDVWQILPVVYVRQFTGFTDKKEVEIYQGDICKYHKNTSKWLVSYHFEVRFKNGAFYAYWEREMMGKLEQHWDLLSQKDMRNIRVVSDIFQSTKTT
ncbi:hypothetical protein ABF212_002547, partial [Flavobacterium psychrophilum]